MAYLKEELSMDKVYYKVTGLKGMESKKRIYKALDDINEVQNVVIDFNKSTVKVEYDGFVKPQAIEQCLHQAGCTIKNF